MSRTSRRFYYRRDYLYAIVVVAAVYAAIIFGLRIESSAKAIDSNLEPDLGDVVFLPVERHVPPWQMKWQQHVLAWIDLLDPTIISLPNQTYGFSQIRNMEFERPFADFERMAFAGRYAQRPTPPSLQLTLGVDDLLQYMERSRRMIPPAMAGTQQQVESRALGIVWTDENGRTVDGLPVLDLGAYGIDLTVMRRTTGPTRIRVSPYYDQFRVRLIRSCGDTDLDAAAVTHLRRLFSSDNKNQTVLARKASPWLGEDSRFDVHWRFLGAVIEEPEADERKQRYDIDWF